MKKAETFAKLWGRLFLLIQQVLSWSASLLRLILTEAPSRKQLRKTIACLVVKTLSGDPGNLLLCWYSALTAHTPAHSSYHLVDHMWKIRFFWGTKILHCHAKTLPHARKPFCHLPVACLGDFSSGLFRSRTPEHASTLQRLQRKDEKCMASPRSGTPLVVPVPSCLSSLITMAQEPEGEKAACWNYKPKPSKNITEHGIHKPFEQALFIRKKLLLVTVIKVWKEGTIIALAFIPKD